MTGGQYPKVLGHRKMNGHFSTPSGHKNLEMWFVHISAIRSWINYQQRFLTGEMCFLTFVFKPHF